MASLIQSFLKAPDYFEYSPWFPNPLIVMRDMVRTGASELYTRLPWNGIGVWLKETWDLMYSTTFLDWNVLLFPLLIAFALTLARVVVNHFLLKRILIYFKLTEENCEKGMESIWKCSIYTITWLWAVYLVMFGEEQYFFNLRYWDTWYPGQPIDPPLYWLLMVQIGLYLHNAYALIYLETIRKDFFVMMLHHILTIGLLLFSYTIRFHKIGLLILFLYDTGDVALELSKTVVYFKERGGKECWWTEMGANFGFAIFTIQHIIFRLYWYPTKAIYSLMHISVLIVPGVPYYSSLVIMLWGLYAMQVYWFSFIVRLLYKILIKGEKIADNRDYEEEERRRKATEGIINGLRKRPTANNVEKKEQYSTIV